MSLYDKTVRLAHENPELREKLLPLLTKTASIERELLEGVISMRELGKVRSTLRKAGDRQSVDLVSEIVQTLMDKFKLSSNEEAALRRLANLPHGSQDPASLRNQVFKTANLLGIRLPSAMFASEDKAARGGSLRPVEQATVKFEYNHPTYGTFTVNYDEKGWFLVAVDPAPELGIPKQRVIPNVAGSIALGRTRNGPKVLQNLIEKKLENLAR